MAERTVLVPGGPGLKTVAEAPAVTGVVGGIATTPFRVTRPVRTQRWLNLGVYGPYGSGKSTLAGTADDVPEMRDVLFIDAESGDLALQNRPDLHVIRITDYRMIARVFDYLRLHCQYREAGNEEKLTEGHLKFGGGEGPTPHYRTVVIDSLTEVFKYALYQLLGTQIGGKIGLEVEPEQANFAEWYKVTEMIRMLVRSFRDLPIHTVFVLSDKTTEDKSQRSTIGLNLSKALAGELPGFMDVLGYLKVEASPDPAVPQDRKLWLQAGHNFLAKNRFPNFTAPFIENPTMGKIYDLILRQEKGTTPE